MLAHGLLLTLRRKRALLWAYAFNLGLALLFSLRLHSQLSAITAHSLAAQRLTSGFDLGVMEEVLQRQGEGPSAGTVSAFAGLPLYFIIYFLLVPGTLFCYRTDTRARLGTLLQSGVQHFWRFVRITLLTLVVSALVLGPLLALQRLWTAYVDENVVGRPAFLLDLAGIAVLLLVASMLRLYFDLVEVYTVELGLQLRKGGKRDRRGSKPDRRIRKALRPALRTLRANFVRAYGTFVFLAALGAGAAILIARAAMHRLAEPRVWPTFLLAQAGLLAMMLSRFWQRGAETILAIDCPLSPSTPVFARGAAIRAPHVETHAGSAPKTDAGADPIPDPEPASPSLPGPDPGVYQDDPNTSAAAHPPDET
jgi:hypothetical protein